MRRTAALIAGGGPAGCAAAIGLARAGARPVVIERSRAPHDIVCGGFLGWDALAALDRLGIDAAALGARPIDRVRIAGPGRVVEVALPGRAAGLSRRTLDAALIAAAGRAGAGVERGATIRRADPRDRAIHLADGAAITAEALFLASGKHELRGAARETGSRPLAIGLRMALAPTPALARALAGWIELHLFDGGYAGLLLQEDGSANLCLSTDKAALAAVGGDPGALLHDLASRLPLLGDRIGRAGGLGPTVTIAGVPYGWRTAAAAPGLFRIGDQAAVIASLAGDGIAIALASGAAAARAWVAGGAAAAPAFQRSFARQAARPLRTAGLARRLAESHRLRGPALELVAAVPAVARWAATLSRIDAGHG